MTRRADRHTPRRSGTGIRGACRMMSTAIFRLSMLGHLPAISAPSAEFRAREIGFSELEPFYGTF